ncbi:hypothetical protein M6G53_17125 [Serratia nevei]|uniref:hypothetical protein n=1 Tax=Serratia nevei TaxID=2703794 RepID=UPI0020A0041E|nr:hypothetical protein [Serratia nevei]MCP1107096.1 hypothetical protein [Serratia nevei]
MKAGRINLLLRSRYVLLLVLMMALSIAGFYFVFSKSNLPECRVVLQISNHGDGGELQRVLQFSLVPSGWRQVTVLINGSFIDEQGKYSIDRTVVMSYRREGQHVNFLVKKNIKRPSDTVTRKDLERRLPSEGLQYHFLVEKIDERHYLFSTNHSPMFICTTPS